jgi:hypothetical protein
VVKIQRVGHLIGRPVATWGSEGLVVPFTRDRVTQSPALDQHGLADASAGTVAAAYYASQPK